VLKGIKQPRQLREQSLIGVLKIAAPMKRLWQELAFAVKLDTSEDRLSPSLEGGKVLRDPIRRHLAVGVGGQDHAVSLATFLKPVLGKVHHRATSCPSMGG
jgi:hypothetical protein